MLEETSSPSKVSAVDLIDNFEANTAQATPNVKPVKSEDHAFDFNSSNIKKQEVESAQVASNKKQPVINATIKKIPNLQKKVSGPTSSS